MKNIFKSNVFMLLMGLSLIFMVSGCTVKNELVQSVQKDLTVFKTGVKREDLIKEIGRPIDSVINNKGNKKDTFVFVQGYSGIITTARITGHILLNVVTWGLYEFATSGLYELMDAETKDRTDGTIGTDVTVLVNYDENDLVSKIEVNKGKSVLKELNSTN